uniref:uncharacterized protein LOC120336441 n=1 Tax=Styela clava TaxID=7725 RepID=UPI00193ACDAC|nr:uncharacterized protein LOC120336441 [Styela clava]
MKTTPGLPEFIFIAAIVIETTFFTFSEGVSAKCTTHDPGRYAFSDCSNEMYHKSICETKCKPGYKLKGPSRMMCWCKNRNCKWTGKRASCERTACQVPDDDTGFMNFIDIWDDGFASLIQFNNISSTPDSEFGWSVVVIFDKPLGETATVMTWNFEQTSASYDGQAFTFVNAKHNTKLSSFVTKDNRLSALIVVQKVIGNIPKAAYVGMYQKRVKDATCLAASKMPQIQRIDSAIAYNKPVKIEQSTATKSVVSTKHTPLSTPNAIEKSTTAKPNFEVTSKTTQKPENQMTKAAIIATTEETTHVSSALTSKTTQSTNVPVITTVKIPVGDFCVLQTHDTCYITDDSWEDGGKNYFSGNVALRSPSDLDDWSMVVVFEEVVDKIETWACRVLDNSEDGFIWTFGPHPWNTKLYGGESDIRFIATQAYFTVDNPNAQVYLCSNTFTSGDAVMSSPNKKPAAEVHMEETTRSPFITLSSMTTTTETTAATRPSARCSPSSPNGRPVKRAEQIRLNFKENNDETKYNYNELLHKSILFYEAQRSGELPDRNRIPWRGDSALKDGCDIGVDLTGGWYDAGDYVKFNFPMAYSLTVLAWGGIEFRDAYEDAGELENMINAILWPTKYFIKTHISKYELVGQIGHGQTDHNYWGRSEQMNIKRPTYIISDKNPGTELAAEVAAGLAAASVFLRPTHPDISNEALQHSKEIYEFGNKYRGTYHLSIPDVSRYYKSYSGYQDELVWAAAWLYKATNDTSYLHAAIKFHDRMGGKHATAPMFSWDNKLPGAQALLAKLTGKADFRIPLSKHLEKMQREKRTPQGLVYLSEWGTNRHAANEALLAIMGANLDPPLPRHKTYLNWAKKQIGLILGDDGRSYVVGFGVNPPKRAHHSSSNCPPYPERCDWTTYHSPKPNHYVLYGAIVGGPNEKGVYGDNRGVYEETEVACDYNAGYQSAIAGLKHFAMKNRLLSTTEPPTTAEATSKLSTPELKLKSSKIKIVLSKNLNKKQQCRPRRSKKCIKARWAARKLQ